MVQVFEKHIECPHPLDGALGQQVPFRRGEHAGDDIERNKAFVTPLASIHKKGNSHPEKQQFGFFSLQPELAFRKSSKPLRHVPISITNTAIVSKHFIEKPSIGHSVNLGPASTNSK
jgi:hypothetical protein